MWAWLIRALSAAGTASLGYFANDIGDGFVRYFPGTQDKSTGKIAWYWMVVILLLIAIIFYLLISLLSPSKKRK